jgi:hypothetical protein
MGLDDGEWIRDEAADPAGEPDDSWPDDEWPDDEWPDDSWPEATPPGGARPAGAGKGRGHGGVREFSVRTAAAVAALAAAAGVAAGLFLGKGTPVASPASRATPSASASAGSSTGLPGLPGLSGNGNGQLRMVLTGRVLAVSGTSITIGGDGPSVTAAVTSATTITGTAHGIGGVKVGNEVSAQITGTASHLTATAIQDPSGTS